MATHFTLSHDLVADVDPSRLDVVIIKGGDDNLHLNFEEWKDLYDRHIKINEDMHVNWRLPPSLVEEDDKYREKTEEDDKLNETRETQLDLLKLSVMAGKDRTIYSAHFKEEELRKEQKLIDLFIDTLDILYGRDEERNRRLKEGNELYTRKKIINSYLENLRFFLEDDVFKEGTRAILDEKLGAQPLGNRGKRMRLRSVNVKTQLLIFNYEGPIVTNNILCLSYPEWMGLFKHVETINKLIVKTE